MRQGVRMTTSVTALARVCRRVVGAAILRPVLQRHGGQVLFVACLVIGSTWAGGTSGKSSSESLAQAAAGSTTQVGTFLHVRLPILVKAPFDAADVYITVDYYRPVGPGAFPVVIYSHGRAPTLAGRQALDVGVPDEQLHFWLERGVAVVAPIRPGYGRSGGTDREGLTLKFESNGQCSGDPDFRLLADTVADIIVQTLAWTTSQPWVETRNIWLEGQSVGGIGTIAAGAKVSSQIAGYINFSGGAGGNPALSPYRSCRPEKLEDLFASLGATTRVPNLWIYAEGDEYWGATAPKLWHQAFAKHQFETTFVQIANPPGTRGHPLASISRAIWQGQLDEFLKLQSSSRILSR